MPSSNDNPVFLYFDIIVFIGVAKVVQTSEKTKENALYFYSITVGNERKNPATVRLRDV